MKKLFFLGLGVIFSATLAFGFDLKSKALDAAGDLASGKSAKEVAEDNKKKLKEEAEKKALEKADEKTGGAASTAKNLLKK